jgi:hypothetical protein
MIAGRIGIDADPVLISVATAGKGGEPLVMVTELGSTPSAPGVKFQS